MTHRMSGGSPRPGAIAGGTTVAAFGDRFEGAAEVARRGYMLV
jgi:hypothetical protein